MAVIGEMQLQGRFTLTTAAEIMRRSGLEPRRRFDGAVRFICPQEPKMPYMTVVLALTTAFARSVLRRMPDTACETTPWRWSGRRPSEVQRAP